MIITHHHMREFGYCNRGARHFFEAYGLDWDDFRKNGITKDKLSALNDALANRLIKYVEGKQ